jgi:hypothetical protein
MLVVARLAHSRHSSAKRDSVTAATKPSLPAEATRPIAFTRPLEECLPYHPLVQAHLHTFGIAVVEPCFRDHASIVKELDTALLQHSAFRRAYRMSLSCVNDGSSKQVTYPQPPQDGKDIYPSPACTGEEVFAFLERQWSHLVDTNSQGPLPRLPPTEMCLYLKDMSACELKRSATTGGNSTSFFPNFTAQLQCFLAAQTSTCEAEMDGERDSQLSAATTRGSPQRGDSLSATAPCLRTTIVSDKGVNQSITNAETPLPRSYLVHPLFMDEFAKHPASLLRLSTQEIDGVHTAYAYLKFSFQFFNLHIEQLLLPFVHHQISGESLWILIPHEEREKLRMLVLEMARVQAARSRRKSPSGNHNKDVDVDLLADVLLYSKSLFPPLSLLEKHSIRYHRVQLKAGQVLVAHGGFAHFGFSTGAGETHAFACNIMTEQWLVSGGPEFVLRYFEWIWQLSQDLSTDALEKGLAALDLPFSHLSNAFNMCPPSYTCDLLSCLQSDLLRYVQSGTTHAASNATVCRYSLTLAQARVALDSIHAALVLLHQPPVRSLLQRFYVVEGDAHLQLCNCGMCHAPYASGPSASADVMRRLSNYIQQVSSLVSTSSDLLEEPMERLRSRTQQMRDAATDSLVSPVQAASEECHPISITYGCITPSACAKMISLLCSEDISPPSLRLSSHSRFLDIGSGVGQVVLQVQLRCQVASAIGIECVRDRHQIAETLLQQLRDRTLPNAALLNELVPYLDQRLYGIRFIHDKIENQLELLEQATHIFLFDAHFHPDTHALLLPRLCSSRPRVVVTCLDEHQLQMRWTGGCPGALGGKSCFRQIGQVDLSISGSSSTRRGYVYATNPPRPSTSTD